MPIAIFISTVSDEFRAYRDQLEGDLTRHNVAVKVQEHFKDLGGDTLDKLDVYITHCHGVVHLVGHMTGSVADERQQQALLAKHSDLSRRLPPLGEALKNGVLLAYTQWEAWLALYHCRRLMIARAAETAPREASYAPTEGSRAAQAAHLALLKDFGNHPGCEFTGPDHLARHILSTAILDLLVEDYAKESAQEREIAEGFIREMAKRVAGDKALDLDGMKQAVRNAIEIYEKEISAAPTPANIDAIVDNALSRAKAQVDKGQSDLARASLDWAAEEMEREEKERRERYVAGVTALRHRQRDIALAAYDGDAAASAILALAQSVHAANPAMTVGFLRTEAARLEEYGRDRGSNVHLVTSITLRGELLNLVASSDERGAAQNSLGNALRMLGEREIGTARLEEAVTAHRTALRRLTRKRAPADWARTQSNLGNALFRLGERESGTTRLEKAVAAYSAALQERRRERAPLDWATTQNNLGATLTRLGARASGTARLEEGVAAFRAALEERTRERTPLEWAGTQNNLGYALQRLGERESGTAWLEEAVKAFRAALDMFTPDGTPLDWAATQNGLGLALWRLGERDNETARLEEAVAAFRAALEKWTREQAPLDWATAQNNLGNALEALGERETGTARLEEAVTAYRAALMARTRERVPLDWAQTQANLGNSLRALGERDNGTTRLEEAVKAFSASLEELRRDRTPLDWAASFGGQGVAMMLIAERTSDGAVAETALRQIKTVHEATHADGNNHLASKFQTQLTRAQTVLDRLKAR